MEVFPGAKERDGSTASLRRGSAQAMRDFRKIRSRQDNIDAEHDIAPAWIGESNARFSENQESARQH